MGKVDIPGAMLTPLKSIFHPKGDVFHAMKASDPGFAGFGEAYFSTVNHGDIKGWKKHRRMTLNLVVPIGEIWFALHDDRDGSPARNSFFDVSLSKENYQRLTVPPGVWLGFKGLGKQLNLLLNLADLEHDPAEVKILPLDHIPFDWSRK
jgi:dTDP-4-dehydrorhamnose 3,5-epimerase